MNYEATMHYGAEQYADIMQALADNGLRSEFIQTGGMNAAITVQLEAGHWLLITDQEDSLSWERRNHEGWYVGIYEPEADRPYRDGETERSDFPGLRTLIGEVLLPGA